NFLLNHYQKKFMSNLSIPTIPMVLKTFLIALSCYIILSNHFVFAQEKGNTFRFPGEFERQKAVWIGWENENTDIQKTVGDIIKGLSGKVPVKIGVPTSQIQKSARQILLKMNVDVSRIQFHIVPGSRL